MSRRQSVAQGIEERNSQPLVVSTSSEAETRQFAATFAKFLRAGDVVALQGDLGTGKTVFVSSVAHALSVPRDAGVRSPSYTLMNLYEGGLWPIAHLDLYRIEDEDELEALGYRDLLDGCTLVFIEWPERVPELEGDVTWTIVLEEQSPEERRLTLTARNELRLAHLRAQVE